MTTYPIEIPSSSLGVASAAIQLSGSDFVVPKNVKSILAVQPVLGQITPTAGETTFATLRIVSSDLDFGNCEMPAMPLGSVLGATAIQQTAPQSGLIYSLNVSTKGGEHIQLYGQTQINCTVAPRMGATLYVSDQPIYGQQQFYYITSSKNNNSSNPTSSGTSATSPVIGQSLTIAGIGRGTIRSLYGIFTSGTIVASDQVMGYFRLSSAALSTDNLSWSMEPTQGFLGTVGSVNNFLAVARNLEIPFTLPGNFSTALKLEVAPANAGNFEHCLGYSLP